MEIIDELTGTAFQSFATPYISRVALEAAEEIKSLRLLANIPLKEKKVTDILEKIKLAHEFDYKRPLTLAILDEAGKEIILLRETVVNLEDDKVERENKIKELEEENQYFYDKEAGESL
jgi:C4-type Zn-finger protein